MANLTRCATPPNEAWSAKELLAFNVRVVDARVALFFNTPELPPLTVSETILANLDQPQGSLDRDDRLFFQFMNKVEHPPFTESRVDEFAAFLLRLMNFEGESLVVCMRRELSFPMAGRRVVAKTDLFLMNDLDEYVLLVQHDKVGKDAEAEVIAEAIAVFHLNNVRRTQLGLELLSSKYIAAIVMIGTAPIFYRIHVTTALLAALATATYPQQETTVLRFIPPVLNHRTDGMRPLANRRIIFQCFEAFKAVVV